MAFKALEDAIQTILKRLGVVESTYSPTGSIYAYAAATAPSGHLLCDGSAVSRTDYASLFKVIGTTYGTGDGTTTFNLPNLKGRAAVGKDAGQTEFDVLGETGGAKTHTLTEAEMPAHNHYLGDPIITWGPGNAWANGAWSSGGYIGGYNPTTSTRGGSAAHNNLQPYIVLNYIIKA